MPRGSTSLGRRRPKRNDDIWLHSLWWIIERLCLWFDALLTSVGLYEYLLPYNNGSKGEDDDDDGEDEESKARRIESCLWSTTTPTTYKGVAATGENQNRSGTDIWELRECALTKGGLLNDKYRQVAWPKLVGVDTSNRNTTASLSRPSNTAKVGVNNKQTQNKSSSTALAAAAENLVNNLLEIPQEEKKFEPLDACIDMIRRDAGRSVIFRYTMVEEVIEGNDDDQGGKSVMSTMSAAPTYASQRLARVLEAVIRDGKTEESSAVPIIHYYQGLHDIAGVILHTLDYDVHATTQILSCICRTHLRDATRENFGSVTWTLNVFLPPLVQHVDPHLYHFLVEMAQVDLANLCLPWVITWFTHDLHDADTAGRLVDAFVSSHPLFPMYVCVALLTHPLFQEDLLQADCDDPASIFLMIKRMPSTLAEHKNNDHHHHDAPSTGWVTSTPTTTVPIQEVLDDALAIMKRHTPRSLLDLVDSQMHPRQELLQAMSNIAAFKTPQSMGVSLYGDSVPGSVTELAKMSSPSYCVRAKLACGVSIWMQTVADSTVLASPTWGSGKEYKLLAKTKTTRKRKGFKMKKLIRIILGKSKSSMRSE